MSKNIQTPLSAVDFINYRAQGLRAQLPDLSLGDAEKFAMAGMVSVFAETGSESLSHVGREIRKALSTDGTVPVGGTTGANALKTTDLIEEIQSTELAADEYAPTWKWINKKPTKQDVVQLTELSDYGGSDEYGFLDETQADGGLDAYDPTLERKTSPVKWLGQYGRVMRTALAVEALGMSGDPEIGNAMEVSSFARLERLQRSTNYGIWHFDNAVNSNEFTGILAQIDAADDPTTKPTVFNMAGNPLTPENLSTVKQFMYNNGAKATDMFAGVHTFTDLEIQLLPSIRRGDNQNVTLGTDATKMSLLSLFPTRGQNVDFHIDPHLDASKKDGSQAAAANAPTKPTSAAVTTSNTSATNRWGSTLAPAGATFYYKVSSVNSKGESDSRTGDVAAVVDVDEKAIITITRADVNTKFYNIYRSDDGGVTFKYLDRVKCTGTSVVYNDKGDKVPGTGKIVFLENMPIRNGFSTVMFRQLWPVDKLKLPTAVMSEQFAWLMAGSPQLLRAKRNILLTNVGSLQGTGAPAARTL